MSKQAARLKTPLRTVAKGAPLKWLDCQVCSLSCRVDGHTKAVTCARCSMIQGREKTT